MSEKPGTPDDENIQVLCPGSGATACESGVDEQELVNSYLTRPLQPVTVSILNTVKKERRLTMKKFYLDCRCYGCDCF